MPGAARGRRRRSLGHVRARALLEAERRRRAAAPAGLEPRGDQPVVVVAGHEHDLGVAERLADRREHRLGGGERVARRPVAQLERVAEQDEPVDAAAGGSSSASSAGRATQDVDAGRGRRGAGRR